MSNNVRVAIAGLGNCANSLIQGVEYYRDADPTLEVPGLMQIDLGGYHVGDVEFVAAFDVDATKVGQDVSKAMWAGKNNTIEFAEVPQDIDVPRVGQMIRFEKSLVKPTDELVLRAAYTWKGEGR